MSVSRETSGGGGGVELASDRAAFLARFDVSRETLARLDAIIDTLGDWRLRSNLIGPKEWPLIWTRHVGDSYRLIGPVLPSSVVVDLGSGAGFPGLILAAASIGGHVTLIESTGKKCAFLNAVVEAANLPATVLCQRAEVTQAERADFVTARAVAPLPKLLEMAEPWMRLGATGLFFKGERWKEELTAAEERWRFVYEATEDRSGGSGIILSVRELRRVGHKA